MPMGGANSPKSAVCVRMANVRGDAMSADSIGADIEQTFDGAGLSDATVQAQRREFGYNEIPEKTQGPVMGTLRRMWGPVPWLLEAAMIFELILGKGAQAVVVFALLVFSALTGEIQESRAKRAIGYLHRQLRISVRVLRHGKWQTMASRELVPGDIVHLKVGDIVPADVQIARGQVSVNESAITGESIDVAHGIGDTLASASTISHGEIIGTVKATGTQSSYGTTAELVRTAEAPGRLQVLLFTIVRYLAYLDIVLAIILVITALIRQTPWQELLPFLVILFIATIPISMPSSFTVANSLEAQNLATQGVLVTGLTGIQEAASMNVILVDKTGTLTLNEPQIAQIVPFGALGDDAVIKMAAAACDATSSDTISTAILRAVSARELAIPKRVAFTAFDPVHKMSRAQILNNGQTTTIVLGSPTVIASTAHTPDDFDTQVTALSARGFRVVAIASGIGRALQCRGLIALSDSPRPDAVHSLEQLRSLGIRVIMLTGDTLETARAIGKQVGIGTRIGTINDAREHPVDFDGFAGVYPQDKYEIVHTLQHLGMVVGMTGDGINDAPALKQADVGVAVSTAVDVAKSAARVVLTEPGLAAIAKVIESGHRVYRRMMTWTITKLARTAQLASLLTIGFIATGFFPVSLSLIVFIVVMNDMVTLTLGTDRAWPTSVPEGWDMPQLAKISALFAVGWLAIGLVLLWWFYGMQQLDPSQISSLMFSYLIYSAMATIIMTRTRDQFWSYAPSKWVGVMVCINVILATLMCLFGWVTAPVPLDLLAVVVVSTMLATLILDRLKMWYYHATGILGTEHQR